MFRHRRFLRSCVSRGWYPLLPSLFLMVRDRRCRLCIRTELLIRFRSLREGGRIVLLLRSGGVSSCVDVRKFPNCGPRVEVQRRAEFPCKVKIDALYSRFVGRSVAMAHFIASLYRGEKHRGYFVLSPWCFAGYRILRFWKTRRFSDSILKFRAMWYFIYQSNCGVRMCDTYDFRGVYPPSFSTYYGNYRVQVLVMCASFLLCSPENAVRFLMCKCLCFPHYCHKIFIYCGLVRSY